MRNIENRHGLVFTARTPESVAAFDDVVLGYLSFDTRTGALLKSVFKIEPDMPMARCLHGYFYMLMGVRALVPKAKQIALTLSERAAELEEREVLHIRALAAWAGDSLAAATELWDHIAIQYPRDILALKMAHFGHFYLGQSYAIRDAIAAALDFWDESDTEYSYMLSMYAFGMVECGQLAEAEKFGRDALARQPADPWAIHAVAHAMEATEGKRQAMSWIDDHKEYWSAANNFRYHVAWHKALVLYEMGEYSQALHEYDASVFAANAIEYLDICNEASLLLRLELAEVDVGERWRAVAEKVVDRTNEQVIAFADVHYVLALASSSDNLHRKAAISMVQAMHAYSESGVDNAVAYRMSAIPLARAIIAFREGRYSDAAQELLDVAPHIPLSGGSHDQRDIFSELTAEALYRAMPGSMETIAYLGARSRSAPHSVHNWKRYLSSLKTQGQHAALGSAQRRHDGATSTLQAEETYDA